MSVSNCLFCDCVLFGDGPDPDRQKSDIPLLLQIFSKYFCLDFNIMTQFEDGDPPEKLPFCPKCESSLVNLSELYCQLEQVKLNISTTVSTLSREIIESTNNNNSNNYGEEEDEDEEEEQVGQGLLHFDMTDPKFVRGYRRAIYQILSPKVILSPVHAHNFQPQPPDSNTNDNCNDFSNANHSHHENQEEDDDEEEEEDGIPTKKFKNNNQDDIPVQIKTEASAQMNLNLFLQEWQQQNHDAGGIVIKTENPVNVQEPEDSDGAQDFMEMETENESDEEEGSEQQQNTDKKVQIPFSFSFKCTICPSKPGFRSNAILKRHLKSHIYYGNVPRPFVCTYENCSSSAFTSRWALSKHEKSHENGLIPCHLCGTKLKSARDFKVHMFELHEGPAVFFCESRFCAQCTFWSEKELENHNRKHHEEGFAKPFKCNYSDCSEQFDYKPELHKHLATHMI